jgi:two-component system, sensor histidine kinase and response regulator
LSSHEIAVVSSYDYRLVALSILISLLASYAALEIAGRVSSARGMVRALWLGCGAVAMGVGIWSMHYVGMLALRLPIPVRYDWPTVLVSLLAAVLASAIMFFVVSRRKMGFILAIVGSVFMGSGIAGMHYIGMAAMRLQAVCHYSKPIVAASIAMAILIPLVALSMGFHISGETATGGRRKALSALVMGLAIPATHYTGMAAASFTGSASVQDNLSHAWSVSTLGIVAIVGVTILLLGFTVITALLDRRFSDEVQQSQSLLALLLESAPESIYGIDTHGSCTFCNQAFLQMTGYQSFADLRGRNVHDVIHHTRPEGTPYPVSECHIYEAFRLGKGTHVDDEVLWRKDGSSFPAEYWSRPLRRDGEIIGTVVTFVDVTERKRAEEVLRDARDAAEAANNAKSAFLMIMSHELRTPMNGIFGMTELVLDSELTAEQREYLGMVQTSAGSLLSMINDILDFAQIEGGTLKLESMPFGLRESLGETIKALDVQAQQKSLELQWKVRPDVPETVVGDLSRVRQILKILIGNAIKFTKEGGVSITVDKDSHEDEDSCLHFMVKDTGIGIAEDMQKKIFEPFSQADGSVTRNYGGTGMGLSICSKLATAMGGKIWVESEPGTGSTFHFTLRLPSQRWTCSASSDC